MKGSHVRYTLSEDNHIAECVRQMPNNLQMAFESAGNTLSRDVKSIQGRYYHKVRFMFKMFYMEHVGQDLKLQPYIMVDKQIIYNVKNLVRR